jgi:hypothetical protein
MRTVAGPEGWQAVEQAGRRTARQPALRRAARMGYLARGAVHAVVGLLALALAAGAGGRATDTRGAVATIASAPAGRTLVALLAAALAPLAFWLVLDAVVRRRPGVLGLAARVGQALSGVAYGWLCWAAARMALAGDAGRAGDELAKSYTARALALPGGRALVLAAAALVLLAGARQIWIGLTRRFRKQLDLAAMSPRLRRWESRFGAVGLATQGVVFATVGVFFARAALAGDAREARGFDGALQEIARQPLGMALLGAVAIGLLAYAAHSFVEGPYRKIGA